MKIFGVEIKRATQATEPNPGTASVSVSLEQANQATKPSLPLASSFPKQTLGDSGTRMLHGIITEEYNPQLQGIQGIRVYDEMRKSDGTVRAAMIVTTLPIRRAKWFVNPATEEQQDQDIANFVEHAIFDWLDQTWDDVLRQALLMLPFGVMIFEKVYGTKEHDGKTYVTLQKLAPRLPKSILQWELPDRTFGIQQIRQDGVLAMIPGAKLLIFVNEREGDNWWGTSMLRAAYKHWYMKNTFYKIDAIAFERQGLGVPTIKMPQGYTDADEKKATQVLQNLRASENAYMVLPPGYEAEFLNMGARTTRDPNASIEHHNKEILQSVLAQFLELGATKSGSGSRALSQDHSDLFLKAMEAIANTVIAEINKNLIPELVDLNFTDVKVYPVLDYSGITKIDVQALGTAYSQLVTAGAITPTNDDQQYLRAAMGLPPRSQDDIDAADAMEPSMEDQLDNANVEEDGQPDPKGPAKPADAKPGAKKPDSKGNGNVDQASKNSGKNKVTNDKKKQDAQAAAGKKKVASEPRPFNPYRPLTMAEQNIDWENIQNSMDAMEANFTAEAKALLNDAKDRFMAKVHDTLQAGDSQGAAALEIDFVNEYQRILVKAMKGAYEYGKGTASKELGIASPGSDAESLANIQALARTVAEKAAADIEAKAKIAAIESVKKDGTPLQDAGAIDSALEDAITKSVTDAASVLVGQGINNGRNDVFAANKNRIYALQRSEVLDERTCDFCLSMDGLVVSPDDDWAQSDTFHSNCRGIWVEILSDEVDPPEITGVPDDLAEYYGGSTNQLVQPKAPIVKPNSPAAAEAQKRKDAKK